ncbi:MAG: type II toxin-antitoxin system Phd/YefM family antitoxin [Deltaproteobacteria bacterium]|nr:type II toxin-antitoxin system Phd/YefM family antitoxin [Deltaproteobacteria bacterium]
MRQTTANQFRANLRRCVQQVIDDHEPLRVTRNKGDFVVIGAEDWQREQETVYVLQNRSLMVQIARSLRTHDQAGGHVLTAEEQDALDHV